MKRARVQGLPLALCTAGELVDLVLRATQPAGRPSASPPPTPLRVGYLNAHVCNLAAGDPAFHARLRGFDVLYADGMAVVRAARRRGAPAPERVNAGDFLPLLVAGCAARGVRVGLLGARAGVAAACAAAFDDPVLGNPIVYARDGFGDDAEAAAAAKEAGVDLLLAGMGSPRQEEWIDAHGAASGARVLWAVGALFEYFAGERARAPVWMRRAGLEWAFRLALEPRRLGGRYLLGNAAFALREWREPRA